MNELAPTRRVKIMGGPSLATVRVTDAETGRELHVSAIRFRPITYRGSYPADLVTVELEMLAEVDVDVPADVRVVPRG